MFIEIYVQSFCNKQLVETMNKTVCFVCRKAVGTEVKICKLLKCSPKQNSNKCYTSENKEMLLKYVILHQRHVALLLIHVCITKTCYWVQARHLSRRVCIR